jgi:hypothetical protein
VILHDFSITLENDGYMCETSQLHETLHTKIGDIKNEIVNSNENSVYKIHIRDEYC